jgi:hypothetical protein
VASRHGSELAAVARRILAWAEARQLHIWWGKGKQDGSFFPLFSCKDLQHFLFAVWTYGRVEIQFQRMAPPFDDEAKRQELLNRLNRVPRITLAPNAITRRPSIALSLLTTESVLKQFFEAFDWVIEEIQRC